MAALRFFTFFTVLLTTAYTYQCYSDQTNGTKPNATSDCDDNSSPFCIKTVATQSGKQKAFYDCADDTQCWAEGCNYPFKGAVVCCCAGNLCNSSPTFNLIRAMIPIAIMKFFGL